MQEKEKKIRVALVRSFYGDTKYYMIMNIKPLKTAWRAHIFYFVKEKKIAKFIHRSWNICPNEKHCPHDL